MVRVAEVAAEAAEAAAEEGPGLFEEVWDFLSANWKTLFAIGAVGFLSASVLPTVANAFRATGTNLAVMFEVIEDMVPMMVLMFVMNLMATMMSALRARL